MKPIRFPGITGILKRPKNMTDEECGSLPVMFTDDGQIVSCWKMNLWERLVSLVSGRIWLTVLGVSHPPIKLSVRKP